MEVEEVEQAEAVLPLSPKFRGFELLSEEDDSEPPKLRGFEWLWELRGLGWLSEEHDSEPPILRGFRRLSEEHDNEPPKWRGAQVLSEEEYSEPTLSPRFVQNCDQVYFAEELIEIQDKIAMCEKSLESLSLESLKRRYELWGERAQSCMFWKKKIELLERLKKLLHMKKQEKLQQMELQQEEEVQQKNTQYLGFLLGVVVLFIYQYLMGYVERGQWNTYSKGAWEFQASYVCIELRLGSYPFQKFRVTPRRFGVRPKNTRNGVTVKYEPWVWFRKRKIYFEVQKTEDKAARIRDVAKYWLKSEGRDPLNFGEEDYNYLNFVQEFHPQQSHNEIKRLVLEHAQRFLEEDQQSQVHIVYQSLDVEPAGFANGEHVDNTIQEFLPSDSDEINNMIQELRRPVDADEQTTDMTEEPQSVSANPEFAGPTIEENIREHREALISSAHPSFIESGCTSQITLIAPCDGTGAVNLFTELKVFRKENWNAKTGAGATSRCALEGCSATMHKFAYLQKSSENRELWPVDIWAKLDAFRFRGWKIELLGNGRWALNSSAGPSPIQSGCTSQIMLIPPCDGTGVVDDLLTELKVFRKENWHPIPGAGATSSCALEGCLSTVHEFVFLQKSGENQELWPVDIWAKLDSFEDHGWKIELFENGRRAT